MFTAGTGSTGHAALRLLQELLFGNRLAYFHAGVPEALLEIVTKLEVLVEQLGVPRRAFQGDHYDIPERYYQACVDLGAEPTDSRVLVRRLRAAGLRKRPSRD